ncbi:2-hydroxyacid dehydrogenase [Mumia zhuanghuii]|uniref:2-hydroxyacid dehydrogenase n=1 Tax=Mumia zhuanghuii TaxID=2585211 RepID=A0A5Q6RK12_9ACTN|nr:2-hydroxyacid dehydrogenase [Mumia zhuanghuii]
MSTRTLHEPVEVALLGRLRRGVVERIRADDGAVVGEPGPGTRIAVVTNKITVDDAMLDALPSLELVASYGVGLDHVDLDAAAARGVTVSHTPGVLDDCVADLAVGALLDVRRRISAGDRHVRSGAWTAGDPYPLGRRLSGTRVGILGLGRIGAAVARRLDAFWCEVGYHSRRRVEGSLYRYASSPLELATWADSLVVTVPGGPGTTAMVDAEVLDALGPNGYLVNVARGTVVDESALVHALKDGRIAGAALDTYLDEPYVPAALLEREDVVLLPHMGSATEETRAAMDDLLVANVEDWLRHGRARTPWVAAAP